MQFGLSERSGGLWHTVTFLPQALRLGTRTLFSFQGTEWIIAQTVLTLQLLARIIVAWKHKKKR